jgi:S1-C subfamily serine protease
MRDAVATLEDAGGLRCAAVWVSRDKLFTAAHCVDDGAPLMVGLARGGYRHVVVLAEHPTVDLAVLATVGLPGPHSVAVPGPTPEYGTHVQSVGHPIGLQWSIAEGVVTGTRELWGHSYWLQASAPMFFGNSGGALFDPQGRLVGIASRGHLQANQLGFWVHPGYLRVAYRKYVRSTP